MTDSNSYTSDLESLTEFFEILGNRKQHVVLMDPETGPVRGIATNDSELAATFCIGGNQDGLGIVNLAPTVRYWALALFDRADDSVACPPDNVFLGGSYHIDSHGIGPGNPVSFGINE